MCGRSLHICLQFPLPHSYHKYQTEYMKPEAHFTFLTYATCLIKFEQRYNIYFKHNMAGILRLDEPTFLLLFNIFNTIKE